MLAFGFYQETMAFRSHEGNALVAVISLLSALVLPVLNHLVQVWLFWVCVSILSVLFLIGFYVAAREDWQFRVKRWYLQPLLLSATWLVFLVAMVEI